MTQMSRLLSKVKRSKKKLLQSHQSEASTEREMPTITNLFNNQLSCSKKKSTLMVKSPSKENSLTLMTQMSRLPLKNKRSKRRLSPSLLSEQLTEREMLITTNEKAKIESLISKPLILTTRIIKKNI